MGFQWGFNGDFNVILRYFNHQAMVIGIEWDFLASGMYLEWQPCSFSRDELADPGFTTTKLSYRFPIFETSATALCGTTGIPSATCLAQLFSILSASYQLSGSKGHGASGISCSSSRRPPRRGKSGTSNWGWHKPVPGETSSRSTGNPRDITGIAQLNIWITCNSSWKGL